jgi:hypothetical protein
MYKINMDTLLGITVVIIASAAIVFAVWFYVKHRNSRFVKNTKIKKYAVPYPVEELGRYMPHEEIIPIRSQRSDSRYDKLV